MSSKPAAPRPAPGPWIRRWLPLGLILAAALAVQGGALRSPFFADDYLFLDQVRDRPLPPVLAAPDPLGNYFRPVSRQIYFWTLAHLTGESETAFHAANLGLFLAAVVLCFALTLTLAGARAAVLAAAFLALHSSADVPVLWASGSQDLLAVVGALCALALHRAGRRVLAAVVLLLALLSKETVLMTPLVAVAVDRRGREPWGLALRRAWPLAAATAAWGVVWLWSSGRRPTMSLEAKLDPAGLPAMLAHVPQVALGLEWPHDGLALPAPPLLPLALAAAGVLLLDAWEPRPATSPASRTTRRARRRVGHLGAGAIVAGLVWCALGALPAFAVADIWSGYYYLFSMCGAAVLIGALLGERPLLVSLPVLVVLAWGSENARRIPEFATARGSWTAQSHLNRFYLERGMRACRRYLGELKRLRPTLPERSTLFFAGLPAQVAFQAADGPLVRWAYRDQSLRSYYLTTFTLERARRGPALFFAVVGDTLRELEGTDAMERIALAMILSETPGSARDILTLAIERDAQPGLYYVQAWTRLALGDTAGARAAFGAVGIVPMSGAKSEITSAFQVMSSGDTAQATRIMRVASVRHVLDPGAHAFLADLLLASRTPRREVTTEETIEAFAARVLAPELPVSWRRWGMVQALGNRSPEAVASLERYLKLAGPQARGDRAVEDLLADLKRRLPGGELAQGQLRR